jgi:hypothetical protein
MEEQLRKDEILFLPIIGTDRFLVIRKDRKGKPLYVSYQDLLNQLLAIISQNGGSGLLLQTNNTTNPVQNVLNLLQGSGVTIVDNGDGSVTISAAGLVTADNGLIATGTNVQLGGATLGTGNLIRNTFITNDGFTFRIDQTIGNALFLNTTTGAGLTSIVGTGFAVRSRSNSGIALEGLSFDDYSLLLIRETAGTNDVIGLIKGQRNTTGAAAAGLGGALELWVEHRNTMPSPSPTVPTATFEGIWLNPGPLVANRVGKFRIRLDLADVQQDILSGLATGEITLGKYGLGAITGTPTFNLAVDANGKVIEVTPTGGGSLLNDTTGILFGGVLSAAIGGTTFSVTAGIGQIVTQTASITGVVTTVSNVTWSAVSGAAITNIGTSQFTYVLVNSSGVVIQQTTPFTDAQYKTHIIIGILCHIDLASVNLVTNAQNVAYEDPHRLVELITAFGPIKKTGLNISANGANLRVDRASGEAFKIGTNYITDQFEPDVSTIAAQTPALLCRVHRNGSGGFIFDVNGGLYYNDIDPSNYDDGSGTLQSVGGSKWTIQRLFFFPNNPVDIICYYGTQTYNQFSEARANLEFETFDEAQITAENAIFLGFLFVRNAATNLSLPAQAAFLQSGLFRGIPPGGGGSGGGGGTVTSVGLVLPVSIFSVTGSPVTTSGDLTGALINQNANTFFAGPATGSPATPSFRNIVVSDLPTLVLQSIYPYNERTFVTGGNNTSSVTVINSTNRLVVTNQGTSTVNFYNLTTGELIVSTAIGTAYHSIYVSAINEVWIFNNTINLFRFDATTGILIATVLGGVGETFGRGSIDDSVNNRVYVLANGRVIRIDTTTFTPTAVLTSGGILGTNFIEVTSGVLNGYYVGLLAGGANSRMIIYNRATDAMAVNDNLGGTSFLSINSTIPSGSVIHWVSNDKFIVTSSGADKILIVEATTTTLTVVDTIYGIQNPMYSVLSNDESLLFVYSTKGANVQSENFISIVDMATLQVIKTINSINIGTGGIFGFQDKANKFVYTVIATSTAGLVNKLIYE